ncbi:MAG: imelysin family protein [Pseudomonadota bacterium]
MRYIFLATLVFAASPLAAEDPDIGAIVERHVLPGYATLAAESANLADSAEADCTAGNPTLTDAYHSAFDDWISVSHLRFGPSERDDRAFALAFWPDPRGSTPKALMGLIRDEDPVVLNPSDFATVSVAARGFYALEFLLFDPQFSDAGNPPYLCNLIKAVTADIAANAEAISDGWQTEYAALMLNPGNDTYRTQTEAAQQFFTALSTGLEFTSQTRLARPMGSFDRPRPNRAEARRSERSLRHVSLSLEGTRALAMMISNGNPEVGTAFEAALQRAADLDDPVFAGVAEPRGRFRVEALQQSIDGIRDLLALEVGPDLGIAAGFNSLDGD